MSSHFSRRLHAFPAIALLLFSCAQSLFAGGADKQAPTVPTGLTSSAITTTGFTVTWTASTDNVAVTGYETFLNGVSQGTVTTTTKVFTGQTPSTTYQVTVRALDKAGNLSAQSNALSVTTLANVPDTAPPSVPAGLVSSAITLTGFTVSWGASTDNVGVTGYETFLNGTSQGTITTTSKNFSGLSASTLYSVTVRSRDAAGNWSAQSGSLAITTLADTTAPSVPVGLAASNIAATSFSLSWTASTDNVGVAGYDIYKGAVLAGTSSSNSFSVTGLSPSTAYSMTVRSRDAAGNVSGASTVLLVTTLTGPQPVSAAISVGGSFVAVLKTDGTIWGWGNNDYGQLGDGTSVSPRPSPVQATGILSALSVAAGGHHTLVARQDGTVLAYGANDSGQLGGGTQTTPISRFTGVKSVAAGAAHSLAVKTDGTLFAWGNNAFGQVGNNKITNVTAPTQLSKITGITQAAAGDNHSLALKTDGTVLGWGSNVSGEVGNGSAVNQLTPVAITGLTGVIAIAAGGGHSLALKSDGTVWAWGSNSAGELGDSTTTLRDRPVQVTGLAGVVAIAAGAKHSLALKNDGTLWAWGSNYLRQLGDGTSVDRSVPTRVTVLSTGTKIAAGANDSFAILADGTIRSWGDATMLGDGGVTGILASIYDDIVQMELGAYGDVLFVRKNGTVWGWGPNSVGELADATKKPHVESGQIPGLNNIIQISQTLALRSDGTVLSWGANTYGQLGDGTITDRFVPAPVPGLTGVVQVAASSTHCLALKFDGTVWAWGQNNRGQLGDGTTTQRNVPTQVPGLSNITWIATSSSMNPISFAVQSDGTAWGWGDDWWALGAGTGTSSFVPIQALVSGVTKVVSDGYYHTLFLTQGGSVYVCGSGNMTAFGGAWYGSTTPLLVPGVGSVVEIADNYRVLARTSSGDIWNLNTDYSPTQLISGVANPLQVTSSPGFGLLYQDGTAALWYGPTLRVAGFGNLASQVADLRLAPSAADTDGDGLPDAWEMQKFGNLTHTAAADDDLDGLTNVQEYLRGTDPVQANADGDLLSDGLDDYPADFYNQIAPSLQIIGGNNQPGTTSQFNLNPFDVAVWSADGTKPLINAPVTYTVASGGGQLSLNRSGTLPLVTTLNLPTDADGTAQVYYKQPATAGVASVIQATAGPAQVTFNTTSIAPIIDSDGDGLTDAQEAALGTNPYLADTDGDGTNDYVEFRQGRDPLAGVLPGGGAALNLVVIQPSN